MNQMKGKKEVIVEGEKGGEEEVEEMVGKAEVGTRKEIIIQKEIGIERKKVKYIWVEKKKD